MKQTIKENFKELQSERGKISIRHNEVMESQRQAYLQYHGLVSEREELLIIGEDEKTRGLDSKIKSLRSQVDKFEKEISDLSPERIKSVVSKHPDSQPHKMALSIQIHSDVLKAKEAYLKAVESAGNSYRTLFDTFLMVKRAEGMLPERKAKKPARIPNWSDFEVSEKELSRSFGSRPFTG